MDTLSDLGARAAPRGPNEGRLPRTGHRDTWNLYHKRKAARCPVVGRVRVCHIPDLRHHHSIVPWTQRWLALLLLFS